MKRLFLLAGIAALVLSSCSTDLPEMDQNEPREVIFNTSGDGLLKGEMDCSLEADYATISIGGVVYTSATFVVNDVLYTQAIKLAPGQYLLEEFILMNDNDTPDDTSDDIVVSAAPHDGAPFADMVINPLDLSFDVEAFLKVEVEVGVLCYEEAEHDNFGFVWFKPNLTHVKEKWFFGDLCTDIFPIYEGSLYGDFPLVDLPAIFKVEVSLDEDLDGIYETLVSTSDNAASYVSSPEGNYVSPLSVKYIDRPDVEDRYELKVYIYEFIGFDPQTGDPVFDYTYYTSWYFTDDNTTLTSEPGGGDVFDQGDDGVFDFVVGFCTYDDPDIEVPDPDDPTLEGCETAFAYGLDPSTPTCFRDLGFSRWGWTNTINPAVSSYYELPIYAGAGQCDLSKGTLVGTLIVELAGATATVTYQLDNGYTMDETHLYIGSNNLPLNKKGTATTVAPGQYPDAHDSLGGVQTDTYVVTIPSGELYIVAHAVVCGG